MLQVEASCGGCHVPSPGRMPNLARVRMSSVQGGRARSARSNRRTRPTLHLARIPCSRYNSLLRRPHPLAAHQLRAFSRHYLRYKHASRDGRFPTIRTASSHHPTTLTFDPLRSAIIRCNTSSLHLDLNKMPPVDLDPHRRLTLPSMSSSIRLWNIQDRQPSMSHFLHVYQCPTPITQ